MTEQGIQPEIVDRASYERAVGRLRDLNILLPTFAQLAEPERIPDAVTAAVATVDPDAPHSRNLFRIHWQNDASRRGRAAVPEHLVLPRAFTGVAAPIVVALGDRFPMIHAHKVLASYGCLAPRLVTGRFDPTTQRAVWPSTGNYCRGGVATSRIMGCRGIAVLPENMSEERFRWLERWVADPADIIRTPGGESNVKEIYDECKVLARDPANVVLNQFNEFGNHLAHYFVTGRALERVLEHARKARPGMRAAAFVSASGSAGTLGAGDYLKEHHGARIVAVEALECPTMLENGYGDHNIQGIGDRHIPYIHNVMNTDWVIGISDRGTDELLAVFNTDDGKRALVEDHDVPATLVDALVSFGLSSICNVLAAVKLAKAMNLGPDDAVFTVATDGAPMYLTELPKVMPKRFPRGFDRKAAAASFATHVPGATTDDVLEMTRRERNRVFNLGYYTWVEQHGVPLPEFDARRDQAWWVELRRSLPEWDAAIEAFNARTGARP